MEIYALIKADTMANTTGGKYYHALTHDDRGGSGRAVCGTKPGKRGYWSVYLNDLVTCPKCLSILEKTPSELGWQVRSEEE